EKSHVFARQQHLLNTEASLHYIIHFLPNATAEELQAVKSILIKTATSNSLQEVTSNRTGLTVFYKAKVKPKQVNDISNKPGVSGVFIDEIWKEELLPSSTPLPSVSLQRRTPGSPKTNVHKPAQVRLQSNAVNELKVISQPPGTRLSELPGYAYADEAGKGITIYVLDTGVNVQSREWYMMSGKKSFLYVAGAVKTETDFQNHGSCVASKAAGPVYGTAKNANIVAVKMPNKMTVSAMFAALVEIGNDVYKKNLGGKAIINISNQPRLADVHSSTVVAYKLQIASLIADDIVIVTGSGNDREDGHDGVTGYPALLGPTMDIIVVGAVTDRGYRAPFSQGTGSALTVSAPGYVTCADGSDLLGGNQERHGTSFVFESFSCFLKAAPAVAGVIAVWLSQPEYKSRLQVPGKVAANVKKMVQSLAYSRAQGEPVVIWNGINPC
ncbi:subtilisin-like protein, partial [Colletotrichum caudatum]